MNDLNSAGLEDEIKSARVQNNIEGEISALKRLGALHQKSRKLTKAASCLLKAMNLVEKTQDIVCKAQVSANLGCVYWEMAQLKKAMTHFEVALKIQRQIQDVHGRAAILTLLGMSYWRKCQWQEGLSYFREALELQETHIPKADNPAYEEYSSLSEALERGVMTLQNRIRLGREQNDSLKILQPIFSMVPLYLFTGREAEIDPLLEEANSLASQLQKMDILEAMPNLRGLISDYF